MIGKFSQVHPSHDLDEKNLRLCESDVSGSQKIILLNCLCANKFLSLAVTKK
jgi:hypothetical protein